MKRKKSFKQSKGGEKGDEGRRIPFFFFHSSIKLIQAHVFTESMK